MTLKRPLFMLSVAALALGAVEAGAADPSARQKCEAGNNVTGEKAECLVKEHAKQFPATGQTTVFRTGDDGDIQAGATLDYTDNGDGTITDNNTGLQWEKKSDDGTIHDKDNTYTWEDAFAVHVATLNIEKFAGYTDWRLPNLKELLSTVDSQNFYPAVSPAFNTNCVANATVLTGSCTASLYWSSTSFTFNPDGAWLAFFSFGTPTGAGKESNASVRAVRGGL